MPKNRPISTSDAQQKISKFADVLNNTSIKGVHDLISIAKGSQVDGIGLLKSLTEDIDKPVFKGLANDMIDLLGTFYASEEVLCCLIKNFILTAELGKEFEAVVEQMKSGDLTIEKVENTALVEIIDQMIAVVSIIITFIQLDVKDLVLPPLDFVKDITDSIIGMLIIALQEIVFTLRDSSIAWIIDSISSKSSNQPWVKCLPYMDFIEILRKYIHDYGFADKLFTYISGVIGAKFSKFQGLEHQNLVQNVKVLEFLKWIQNVLVKLRNATLEWSFCVDTSFVGDDDTDDNVNQQHIHMKNIIKDQQFKKINLEKKLNNILADDNTILSNSLGKKSNTKNPVRPGSDPNNFRPPSNDEIKAFLVTYLGVSNDFADQLTGFTNSSTNIQGTLSSDSHVVGNDCGLVLDRSD